jgi:hypothetical protein
LERLSVDWELPIANREVVRQMTQSESAITTPGYLEDQDRFACEFARRYFSICSSVIRHYDPNHLILGCRFAEYPGDAIISQCTVPHVDVVSIRPGRDDWDRTAQRVFAEVGGPVLLTELSWSNVAFARAPMKRESRRLTSIERMLKKGRLYLERVFEHRGVVGYEWARWVDAEDEQPPFGSGLVHLDDREALEHTELLSDLNRRAETLRIKSSRGKEFAEEAPALRE